jgi:hypothetical protein
MKPPLAVAHSPANETQCVDHVHTIQTVAAMMWPKSSRRLSSDTDTWMVANRGRLLLWASNRVLQPEISQLYPNLILRSSLAVTHHGTCKVDICTI